MVDSRFPTDIGPRPRGRPRKVVATLPQIVVPASAIRAPELATASKPAAIVTGPVEPIKPPFAALPAPVVPPVAGNPVAPEPIEVKPALPAADPVPAPVVEPAAVATKPIFVETMTADAPAPAPMKGLPMATTFAPSSFSVSPEGIQSMFADMQTRAKASVEKNTRLAGEMGEFAKGNVEAVMTSSRIAAKGAETLGQEAVEYGKRSFEGAAAAFKTMVAAKSPTELFKLQSDYARASFDAAVSEGSKLSEAWLKLFGEIAQPLSSRVALAADKIKAPVA